MKNIHILPTEKPSRLVKQKYDTIDRLCLADMATKRVEYKRFNLYITNSEEIKIDEYYIHGNRLHKHLGKKCLDVLTNKEYPQSNLINKDSVFKKVILSTDLELQKDGVQAIDDEFLEWFVKNPSCEEIEISHHVGYTQTLYFIVIPKEEPKQHVELINDNIEEFDKAIKLFKQETLEETAERKFQNIGDRLIFEDGAKWQKERSYSEEEVKKILHDWSIYKVNCIVDEFIDILTWEEWFEQFKNK